jgi:hypothetical protein
LGDRRRESGHSRVPTPPAITIANIGLTVPPAHEPRGHRAAIVETTVKTLKRIGLGLLVAVLAFGAYAAWYVYGQWPVPEGYAFPRHSMWGSGPAALFEGTLEDVDGCIRTSGAQQFTVVWPPGYSLAIVDGEPVIRGGSRDLRMSQSVRMGGGYYESGDPPPTTLTVGNCPPPYFLSTGFAEN